MTFRIISILMRVMFIKTLDTPTQTVAMHTQMLDTAMKIGATLTGTQVTPTLTVATTIVIVATPIQTEATHTLIVAIAILTMMILLQTLEAVLHQGDIGVEVGKQSPQVLVVPIFRQAVPI